MIGKFLDVLLSLFIVATLIFILFLAYFKPAL